MSPVTLLRGSPPTYGLTGPAKGRLSLAIACRSSMEAFTNSARPRFQPSPTFAQGLDDAHQAGEPTAGFVTAINKTIAKVLKKF